MSDPAATIAARLAELWRTSRPIILERMAVLRAVHHTLSVNPADVAAGSQGREAAHKLSGVLGVFGLPQGSEIAAEIEGVLKSQQHLNPADLIVLGDKISALDAVIASKSDGSG